MSVCVCVCGSKYAFVCTNVHVGLRVYTVPVMNCRCERLLKNTVICNLKSVQNFQVHREGSSKNPSHLVIRNGIHFVAMPFSMCRSQGSTHLFAQIWHISLHHSACAQLLKFLFQLQQSTLQFNKPSADNVKEMNIKQSWSMCRHLICQVDWVGQEWTEDWDKLRQTETVIDVELFSGTTCWRPQGHTSDDQLPGLATGPPCPLLH